MDIDSYNKLPYKERLAMAEHVQDFVSQLKAQHFDPFLDYAFAEDFTEDFAADFLLPYTAVNREPAKITLINSVNPDLADKCIRPVNTAAISFYMSAKKGQGKSEASRIMTMISLKKRGLIP